MDLFLVPNNPLHTVLVSPNRVAHYQVQTSKEKRGPKVSRVQRPAESEEDSIVAEVEWHSWCTPTKIRCPLLGDFGGSIGKRGSGIPATSFLYKSGNFSS